MKRPLIALLVTSAFLAACSKNDEQYQSNPQAQGQVQEQMQEQVQEQATTATTPRAASPRGDASKPLSEYRRIDSGADVMFMYYGLLNEPLNYERITSTYSREYNQTNDVFKKQDILNALRKPIDEQIEAARKSRYIVWDIRSFSILANYDMASQSFRINDITQNAAFSWSDVAPNYRFAITNADQMGAIKVSDEAKARKIESLVSKRAPMVARIYAFATEARVGGYSGQIVNVEIMRVEVIIEDGLTLSI